jgi:hypothetical protein
MGASAPPSALDAAAALAAAYRARHGADPPRSAIVLPLAQLLGEGSLSSYFLGTNNLGAMHATQSFATRHARDRGYGMVAFLDHAPGPVAYITRMAVYPSLLEGARAFYALLERMVDLTVVPDATEYATALYAHGFFEGMAAPATPIAARAAAEASGSWTPADRANIASYALIITSHVPSAERALDALPNYAGDPSALTSGPPFAPLAARLTPAPAYAPHTLEHARALLEQGPSVSVHGGLSLDEVLAANPDGVWLFDGAAAPSTAVVQAPQGRVMAGELAALGALLAAASIATAIGRARIPAVYLEAA